MQWRASLLRRASCAAWRARALEIAAAASLVQEASLRLSGVRGVHAWSRFVCARRRERSLYSRAVHAWCARAQTVAVRRLGAAARSPRIVEGLVVVIDAGASEWFCGFDCDSGPAAKLPAIGVDDATTLRKQLRSAFDELDAVPSEHAVLFCEAAGATSIERDAIATILVDDLGVCALHFAAAPLLAIYNNGFDTGILVDVGTRVVHVYMMYEGIAVLDTASAFALEDAQDSTVVRTADAVLRTIALAEMSVRGALLAAVVLVGSGSMAADFPSALEAQLASALRGSVWKPRVKANVDRRYASWLGGTIFCSLPSAQRLFVPAADYKAGGSARLHERALPLASTELEALELAHMAAVRVRVDLMSTYAVALSTCGCGYPHGYLPNQGMP